MATLQELAAKVAELEAAVDAEQAQAHQTVEDLNAVIAELEALVAQGGTAEERQAIVDQLVRIREDVESTFPDVEEPETPVEPEA